jgi:para-nitrobenzyl esterase
MGSPLKKLTRLVVILLWITQLLAIEGGSQGVSCFVSTESGDVQGSDLGASCAFLGIPFAGSTADNNRWKPPQPAAPWPSVLNATTAASNCAQIVLPAGVLQGSEDCLKLNIWVSDPPPSRPAPVMVVLHTGAFFGAGANFVGHNGQRLAEETGAIVVAPFYRLGPFGFLAHSALAAEDPARPSSGNYGLLDQRAALEWIRDNIAQFGGDPNNVTLTGTSAGGQSVGLQMASPGSAGLFHRAIIQSAYPTSRWATLEEAATQGNTFAAALGCTDASQVLACMRSKTRNEVLLALSQATQQVVEPPNRVYWEPIVDGLEIPDQPRALFEQGRFHHVPTIIGANRDEGWGNFINRSFSSSLDGAQYEAWVRTEVGEHAPDVLAAYPTANFPSPREALARIVSDGQFVSEARRLARLVERTGTPTFLYSYEYELDDISLDHVPHGLEQFIIFGNDYVAGPVSPVNHPLTPADRTLHTAMAGYWTRFAATGNPNSDDDRIVHWPAFKHPTGLGRGSDKYLVFDSVVREGQRLREEQCDFWEPFFLRSMLSGVPAAP